MSTLTVKTTPAFDRAAKKLFTQNALEEFYDYVEAFPEDWS